MPSTISTAAPLATATTSTTSTAMPIVFYHHNHLTSQPPTTTRAPTPTRRTAPPPCPTYNWTRNLVSSTPTTSIPIRTFRTLSTLTITNHFLDLSEKSNRQGFLQDVHLAISSHIKISHSDKTGIITVIEFFIKPKKHERWKLNSNQVKMRDWLTFFLTYSAIFIFVKHI